MFKIGDRIKTKRTGSSAEVIDILERPTSNHNNLRPWDTRIHIRYFDRYAASRIFFGVNGDLLVQWVSEDDIGLDIEYYRDLKINSILE